MTIQHWHVNNLEEEDLEEKNTYGNVKMYKCIFCKICINCINWINVSKSRESHGGFGLNKRFEIWTGRVGTTKWSCFLKELFEDVTRAAGKEFQILTDRLQKEVEVRLEWCLGIIWYGWHLDGLWEKLKKSWGFKCVRLLIILWIIICNLFAFNRVVIL